MISDNHNGNKLSRKRKLLTAKDLTMIWPVLPYTMYIVYSIEICLARKLSLFSFHKEGPQDVDCEDMLVRGKS